jgi:hypothetical protein
MQTTAILGPTLAVLLSNHLGLVSDSTQKWQTEFFCFSWAPEEVAPANQACCLPTLPQKGLNMNGMV